MRLQRLVQAPRRAVHVRFHCSFRERGIGGLQRLQDFLMLEARPSVVDLRATDPEGTRSPSPRHDALGGHSDQPQEDGTQTT
jgi:hypothetical protein